ncbi:tetraacyldisaccharide 4'-kinase, partial [Bacteroidota bacterium]
ISIGNLTVGGSGKTPAVIYICNLLKNHKRKIGVLSRGYRRRTKGYLLVSSGADNIRTVSESGDEMYLVTKECKIPSAVCESRVKGAKKLIKETNVEAVILDDAFQHRWIYRDLDIVLIDQKFLLREKYFDHLLLPTGLKREPFSSIRRSDLIIINRKFSDKKTIPKKYSRYFDEKKIFHAYYKTNGFYDLKTDHFYNLMEFRGQKSLVVCGIASPFSFLRVLSKNLIDIQNKILFLDHKHYTLKEIQEIRRKFYKSNVNSVITTQKDAVKLTEFSKELDDIDIYYLKIDLMIDEDSNFNKEIVKIFN